MRKVAVALLQPTSTSAHPLAEALEGKGVAYPQALTRLIDSMLVKLPTNRLSSPEALAALLKFEGARSILFTTGWAW